MSAMYCVNICIVLIFLTHISADNNGPAVPPPVSSLNVVPQTTSLRVTWVSPPDTEPLVTQYVIYCGDSGGHSQQVAHTFVVASDIHEYVINNLEPDTEYMVGLQAANSLGMSELRTVIATTLTRQPSMPGLPPPVSSVSVTPESRSLRVTWVPAPYSNPPVERYVIYLGDPTQFNSFTYAVPPNINDYLITNLDADTEYMISVKANNRYGTSEMKTVKATTLS